MGRAIQTRAVAQIPDVLEDPAYAFKSYLVTMGFRSLLVVPMLRQGEPMGAIAVGRPEPGPFTDKQIELLQTFAEQAMIAIENVRLFTELQARTLELTRSVGELQALGEVGQAVSSTLDLQTVLIRLRHRRGAVQDEIRLRFVAVLNGDDDPRVAPEILRLLAPFRRVEQRLIALNVHPDHRHLRTPIRVERDDVAVRLVL
jgi:GAF domain-containing protein